MATVTASMAAATVQPREIEKGVQSVTMRYNAGATALEASAQTILMAKIPNHCLILDLIANHTTGATSAPTDYGIQGSLSLFASQATQGVRVSITGVPYEVSLTDNATPYVYITATPTLASSTTSYKCNLTVLYKSGTDH